MRRAEDEIILFRIKEEMLITDHYYAGFCRNAKIAKWDGKKFLYWREKFGNTFIEEIDYWTPEGEYDEFIPVIQIGPKLPKEINNERT